LLVGDLPVRANASKKPPGAALGHPDQHDGMKKQ
jgi:hypothetical protein